MFEFDELDETNQPPASPPPAPPQHPNVGRSRRALLSLATAGVIGIASIGVLVGHFTWPGSAKAGLPLLNSSAGRSNATGNLPASGGININLPGNLPGFSFPGALPGAGNSGGLSSGSATTAVGAPSNAAAIATGVDPGLVDINTDLSYQGAQAAGTGMVLTSNGEVLTNNHVIDGATTIRVTDIGNGKTYSAKVVGYDRSKDIAVLQLVNASGLTTVPLGNSSTVKAGDAVVGIGNAQGAGGTPSYAGGAVTAVAQTITASDQGTGNSERLHNLLGTNADIQPGDSGGPLVNSAGQVIGIDTAGTSSSGGFFFQSPSGNSTQGYAIPINDALSVAKLITLGTRSSTVHIGGTAFIGVEVAAANTSTSTSIGGNSGFGGAFGNSGSGSAGNSGTTSPATQGAVIAGVVAGSPAAKSGLNQGEIITALDGHAVTSPNTLSSLMLTKRPGSKVRLTYEQAGVSHTVTLKLASGPPQ